MFPSQQERRTVCFIPLFLEDVFCHSLSLSLSLFRRDVEESCCCRKVCTFLWVVLTPRFLNTDKLQEGKNNDVYFVF